MRNSSVDGFEGICIRRLPIWAGVFAVMHFQVYNIAASREVCYNILNLKFFKEWNCYEYEDKRIYEVPI